jgi:hypothetical protein
MTYRKPNVELRLELGRPLDARLVQVQPRSISLLPIEPG